MGAFFRNVLTASIHGSIVILAVLLLRLVLRKAPRKLICFLWTLAGLRLLLPVPLQSRFSLQPPEIALPVSLPGAAAIIWVGVAIVIASYSLLSYFHLRRRVVDAVKVPGGWESDRIETAFVLGFVKPKIYIPAGMPEETRKQILAHERTHLDKGDHWIKVIGFAALALHWFNPLVWLAYALLCKDIEMACDERVVQFMDLDERKAYASALLQCSTDHVHYAACPVAFGEVSVKHRIQSALHYKKPGFLITLLAVAAIGFVAVCLLTSPPETAADREEQLREASRQDPASVAPAVAPQSEPNPDWGITFFLDAESPTGGTLVYAVEERYAAAAERMEMADTNLERWNGSGWEPVGQIPINALEVGFAQSRDRAVNYFEQDLDWETLYGSLDSGDYRIAQTISDDTGSAVFYATFHIYREALPEAEEAALARCEAALDQLTSGGYSVLLSDSTGDDGFRTQRGIIRTGGNAYEINYYLGDFLTSSLTGENAAYEAAGWDEPFHLNQNRRFLFPEEQSVNTQEEISFRSVWETYDGTLCMGTDTYCFDDSGNLTSVCRVTERMDGSGNAGQTRELRLEVLKAGFWPTRGTDGYAPEDSFEAQEQSPWGIFFRVDDDLLGPGGGEVWLGTDVVGMSPYTTDGAYWLERRVGKHWQRLGDENKEASWTEETIPLGTRTVSRSVDWTAAYGELDAGVYRMGKRFYNGAESIIQYAEFSISPLGGVYGDGGEETLARVDAAAEKLQKSAYRVEKWTTSNSTYDQGVYLDQVIWHWGDTQVTDFYSQEQYSHSYVDREADGLFYGDWLRRSWGNADYDCVYFGDGCGAITDGEVSFGQTTSNSGSPCILYTYSFDGAGNLRQIRIGYADGSVTRYIVTETEEAEIRTYVAEKQP